MATHETRHKLVKFNPRAMLRVVTLAASAAENDADKRDVLTIADLADVFMRPQGGFHLNHPLVGDVDSARALVEGLLRFTEDFAKGDGPTWEERRFKRAQELIDKFSSGAPPQEK